VHGARKKKEKKFLDVLIQERALCPPENGLLRLDKGQIKKPERRIAFRH